MAEETQKKPKRSLAYKLKVVGKISTLVGALTSAYIFGEASSENSLDRRICKDFQVVPEVRRLNTDIYWDTYALNWIKESGSKQDPQNYKRLAEGYKELRLKEQSRLENELIKLNAQREALINREDYQLTKRLENNDISFEEAIFLVSSTFLLVGGGFLWFVAGLHEYDRKRSQNQ